MKNIRISFLVLLIFLCSFFSCSSNNYFDQALKEFMKEDFEHAEKNLLKHLKRHPDDQTAHLLVGYIKRGQKDDSSAVQSFKNILMINPTNTLALYSLASIAIENKYFSNAYFFMNMISNDNIYYMMLEADIYFYKEFYDKALILYSTVLAKQPNFFMVYFNRSSTYINLYHKSSNKSYLQLAENDLKSVFSLASNFSGTYYNYACIYSLLGQYSNASVFLKKAYDKGYDDIDGYMNDSDLSGFIKSSFYNAVDFK